MSTINSRLQFNHLVAPVEVQKCVQDHTITFHKGDSEWSYKLNDKYKKIDKLKDKFNKCKN